MRILITLCLALGLCLAVALTGCDEEKPEAVELTDEVFVEYRIALHHLMDPSVPWDETVAAERELMKEFGLTEEDLFEYHLKLGEDPARAEKVVEMVRARDEEAAVGLAITLGLDIWEETEEENGLTEDEAEEEEATEEEVVDAEDEAEEVVAAE